MLENWTKSFLSLRWNWRLTAQESQRSWKKVLQFASCVNNFVVVNLLTMLL